MEWNGMEWNGMRGMECAECAEWNRENDMKGTRCSYIDKR